MWKSTNVLVTGAGGFIGSHLTEELLKKGANVTALVNYNSRNDYGMLKDIFKMKSNNLDIFMGDIRDKYFVAELLKEKRLCFPFSCSHWNSIQLHCSKCLYRNQHKGLSEYFSSLS